jgi:hypothetical protein
LEGRIFSGTAKQIVQQMQRTAIFAAHLSVDEYVNWCVENARRSFSLDVKVTGATTDERCASLLEQMLGTGFAEKI